MTEPLAVPIPEAARMSGLGRSTIYAEISKGNLKIRKVGRRTIVMMTDLREFLDSKIGEAA
jgi:excisionase family DNA binding protein